MTQLERWAAIGARAERDGSLAGWVQVVESLLPVYQSRATHEPDDPAEFFALPVSARFWLGDPDGRARARVALRGLYAGDSAERVNRSISSSV